MIHPSAIIHKNARIGKDCEIGPYCVVGENVVLGDRCRLLSHVVVDGHTIIGEDNQFFPFSSIGFRTQDRKWKPRRRTPPIQPSLPNLPSTRRTRRLNRPPTGRRRQPRTRKTSRRHPRPQSQPRQSIPHPYLDSLQWRRPHRPASPRRRRLGDLRQCRRTRILHPQTIHRPQRIQPQVHNAGQLH